MTNGALSSGRAAVARFGGDGEGDVSLPSLFDALKSRITNVIAADRNRRVSVAGLR